MEQELAGSASRAFDAIVSDNPGLGLLILLLSVYSGYMTWLNSRNSSRFLDYVKDTTRVISEMNETMRTQGRMIEELVFRHRSGGQRD